MYRLILHIYYKDAGLLLAVYDRNKRPVSDEKESGGCYIRSITKYIYISVINLSTMDGN
jgi:hypothetical protein